MNLVADNNKIILRDDKTAPFTIERIGDRIVLQEYRIIMRLGELSAKWLYEAFTNVISHNYTQEQALDHNGKKVLTILNESGYIFIIGINARFVMRREVAAKLFTVLGDLILYPKF